MWGSIGLLLLFVYQAAVAIAAAVAVVVVPTQFALPRDQRYLLASNWALIGLWLLALMALFIDGLMAYGVLLELLGLGE